MDKMTECIGYLDGEPIYVEVEEEVHPMFMGVIDGKEIWTNENN